LLIADQQPAKSSLIDVFGQVISLIFIIILVKTTEGSLIKLGIALCLSPLLVLIGANIFFFRKTFKQFRPKLSKIRFSYSKGLFNLGIIFFIIQIAAILQYETANIIILRNFGTVQVTSYNIVYKYFSVLNMVFMIFLAPFWSASTEAYLKKDIQWIRNSIKKYNQLNVIILMGGIIMLIFSQPLYNLWLGEGKVPITFSLSFWGFIFFNVGMFGSKYVNFLNGINALRLQFWTSLISPFIYIGIALLLINYTKMGVNSLFIAAIIANANAFIVAPLQYYQVIVKGKKGIWIR
jgi:O-antigen/teichoic acid export membrane protein